MNTTGDTDDARRGQDNTRPVKVEETTTGEASSESTANGVQHVNVNSAVERQAQPVQRRRRPVFAPWTRFTDGIHHYITQFVVALAIGASRHPFKVIPGVIVLSLALVGIGFVTNFHINVKETEIYAPFTSTPKDHFIWREEESGFLKPTRVTTLVVHADGENVLGLEPMRRVFAALDTVRNISGYHDICEGGDYLDERTGEYTCRIISATRYWYHDTELFYEDATTDQDIASTLSLLQYPSPSTGGVPTDHEYVLGKYEREENEFGNGTVTYVPAYFVYVLLSIKDETPDFEVEVVHRLTALQEAWDNEDGNNLKLDFFAERSFSDEFTRAIEEDMYLVPVIFFIMSGFTCLVFFRCDRVQSRLLLGVGSVTTVGMSLMSGFGLLFIIGVPYTSMTTILPFVVFGVGLDDTFIITGSYLRTDPAMSIEERIRITMEDVGSSISVTTITTISAFILGLTSSVPAIFWLCLYAFPTIAIDFIYQISFFIAILVLDERRIQAKRKDVCIWCTAGNDGIGTGPDVQPQEQVKHIADRVMCWYAKQLLRPLVKGVVVVFFLYFFGLCIYRTTRLTQEFDVTELFPEGSYVTDVLDAMTEYQERALQVEIYFRDVNQSDPAIQQQMLDFVDEVAQLPAFGAPPPLCWVRDFQLIRETDYFDLVKEKSFEDQVEFALQIPAIKEAYGMDIVHENGVISASRCQIMMKNSVTEVVQDQIDVLLNQRSLTNAQPINKGREREAFFTFNQIYLLWEFYNIAVQELITTTVASVVAVSAVALFFIPHWTGLLFIVPMVSIVYIDLLGTMEVAGLHINAVTYVCLVISIGLIVDFLMHILLRYNESTCISRDERVRDTLETMGASILLGGLSTFLGVIPLAFSTSTILRTVFTSLFSMVVLGITHGLILLPVLLSLIGPASAGASHIQSGNLIELPSEEKNSANANATREAYLTKESSASE